jgi:hypothetical protein
MAHNFYYNNFIDKEEKKLDNLRQSIDEKEKEMRTMFLEKNKINNNIEIIKLKKLGKECDKYIRYANYAQKYNILFSDRNSLIVNCNLHYNRCIIKN